ncbi:MAG: intermembrane phospholipid transport protein YdbH family protein [Janthinobacterium lividum]
MTEQSPDERPARGRPKRRLPLGRVGTGLVIGGTVVAVGLGGLYVNRRTVADEVLVGWLEKRGIQADVEVERFEWDGFVGRITVGDPDDPDVRIDRVVVDYDIGLPWSKDGMGVSPRRVVLTRPLIKAQWLDGRFSLGSLDPLIEEFTSKPPSADKRGPLIVVSKGQALLTTGYGLVTLRADARIDDGRLKTLTAELPPSALDHANLNAAGLSAKLQAQEVDGRLVFAGHALADAFRGAGVQSQKLDLNFEGGVPYPANGAKKALGAVVLKADLTADALSSEGFAAQAATGHVDWRGEVDGWLDAFLLQGELQTRIRARDLRMADNRLNGAAVDARNLQIEIARGQQPSRGTHVVWRAEGPLSVKAAQGRLGDFSVRDLSLSSGNLLAGGWGRAFEAQGPLTLTADRLSGQDLDLRAVRGRVALDAVGDTDFRIGLRGSLSSRGASYNGLGPVAADDAPELADLKAAARSFDLSAPDLRFVMGTGHSELVLSAPATLRPATGGTVTLSQGSGPIAIMASGQMRGSARLVAEGGELPLLQMDVPRWTLNNGALDAALKGTTRLDFTPAKGIFVNTEGRLRSRGGVTTYSSPHCAELGLARFDLGENGLEDINGQLCNRTGPLLRLSGGRWEVRGQLTQTQASAGFAAVRMSDASGNLLVAGDNRGLRVDLGIQQARLTDTGETARFNPLDGSGRVTLASNIWRGDLNFKANGQPVADVCLLHDAELGQGGLGMNTRGAVCTVPRSVHDPLPEASGELLFAEGGLQPQQLTGMIPGLVAEPVKGRAAFAGQMFWTSSGLVSSGRLKLRDLSFVSPVGTVEGGRGDIHISSLAPLVIPPKQELRFDRVDGPLPMSDVGVDLGVQDDTLFLQRASVNLASGTAYLFDHALYDPERGIGLPSKDAVERGVEIPFKAQQKWRFGVALEGVQLNELLEAVGAEQKAYFDAEVSGVLPVVYRPEWGFAVTNGVLMADRRGKLSLSPELLGTVETDEGALATPEGTAPIPRNMMQDLAYQALENLTFTDLSATVNSICMPQSNRVPDAEGYIRINGGGVWCQTLPEDQLQGDGEVWVPSRLALDFTINGFYDPPERKEMRLSLLDVLQGNFMKKKMVLPSDTPVTLNLKTSINAYDLASQIMDYVRLRNTQTEMP